MFRYTPWLLAIPLALLATGCDDSTSPQVPTSIALDTDFVSLGIGETATLSAEIRDQDNRQISPTPEGFEVAWESTNPDIFTVSDGVVTGVGQGTAQAVVSAGELPAENVVVEILPNPMSGDLSFTYSGQISGNFSVSAEFRSLQENDWVITLFDPDEGPEGVTDIIAQYQRSDGLFDFAWFWVAGRVSAPGTHPAVYGYILMGVDQDGAPTEGVFDLTSGDITFTTVTNERMTGTFAYTLGNEEDQVVEVTDGAFDAPYVGEAESPPEAAAAAFAIGAADLRQPWPLPGPRSRR